MTLLHFIKFQSSLKTRLRMRDLRYSNCTVIAGTFIFSGEYRPLPVPTGELRAYQVNASLKRSPLWPHITKLELKTYKLNKILELRWFQLWRDLTVATLLKWMEYWHFAAKISFKSGCLYFTIKKSPSKPINYLIIIYLIN